MKGQPKKPAGARRVRRVKRRQIKTCAHCGRSTREGVIAAGAFLCTARHNTENKV